MASNAKISCIHTLIETICRERLHNIFKKNHSKILLVCIFYSMWHFNLVLDEKVRTQCFHENDIVHFFGADLIKYAGHIVALVSTTVTFREREREWV